jgi:uncharacterized membrane protein
LPLGLSAAHLVLILVVVLITAIPVAVIVVLVRLAARRVPPDPSAILARRLALGEITREDFDTAMRALGLAAPPSWGGPTPRDGGGGPLP